MIPAWKVTPDIHKGEGKKQDTQVEETQELKIAILMMKKIMPLESKYLLPYLKVFPENDLMHIFWLLKIGWKPCYSEQMTILISLNILYNI